MNANSTVHRVLTGPDFAPADTRTAPSPASVRAPHAGGSSAVAAEAMRFTVDGSDELEQHLARTCEKIAAGVRGLIPGRRLQAVLLGGGYGRGEGGVLRTPSGDRPYNDLEFYVCLRGNRHVNERRFGRALHVLGEILTPQAGAEVEFKITSLRELRQGAISMFSYDLMLGHRWLVGRETMLAGCAHHRDAEQIPMIEATRLLMNRCSGLLFAQERLVRPQFTAADADFVRRNIAKAELALGDAVLVAFGHYHWSVRERHRRMVRLASIETMPWLEQVCQHHAAGTEFKLHPERSAATREQLRELHAPLVTLAGQVWLWLEGWRLRARFGTARGYALCSRNKCPKSSRLRNVLVNLKALGTRPFAEFRATHHPRERILHALSLLLWEPATLVNPALLRRVQRELGSRETDFSALLRAYRELWSQVN